MRGCGHCEEYAPRLAAVAAAYPDVALVTIDGRDARPQAQHQLNRFNVHAFPTVVVARRNSGYVKYEGTLSTEETQRIFNRARAINQENA